MLTESEVKKINEIFSRAIKNGRSTLYEFEVYGILKALGLETPKYVFVKDPEEISSSMLKKFPGGAVLKIVSSQIAHKQKLGGVKKISTTDPLYVKYVFTSMIKEVLGHFPEGEKPVIDGCLITEFIPHSQALGHEILVGFYEDIAFGPVMTLSKGGDDAEFFARYYDPANLFLPPLDMEQTGRLANSLKVRHRYAETGNPDYIDRIAYAAHRLSLLAYVFSSVYSDRPEHIIKEMDINPFVFSEKGRFVAVDGFCRFEHLPRNMETVRKPDPNHIESLFYPEGIAVVGVSLDPAKYSMGREIAILLDDLGRKDIYFVNRKGGSIQIGGKQYPLYSALSEVPVKTDLVVYTASAAGLMDFAGEIAEGKHKALIIISGVPAENNFAEFREALLEKLPHGIRVLGPNCMGVYSAPEMDDPGINTLFIEKERLDIQSGEGSNTVLLSQSGGVALTEIDRLHNSRVFRKVVSFGNKIEINIPDLMEYFSRDEAIRVISLYIEGLGRGEGRAFYETAANAGKPVVVYKSGKTEAGARAARSHTASMSGSYDVFRAACEQAGIVIAEKIEEHYEFIKIFSLLAGRLPAGRRVAFVLNAGFESTVGADELSVLEPAALSEKTVQSLKAIDRFGLIDKSTSLIDMTPLADDAFYENVTSLLIQDPNVDCIVVAVLPHTKYLKTDEKTFDDADSIANRLIKVFSACPKPLVVSVNGGKHFRNFMTKLEENGLPVFQDIRSAIGALEAFVGYHLGNDKKTAN